MTYYLARERNEDPVGSYGRYQRYLQDLRAELPSGAFALGTSEWYYDPRDHRCPHDGWLEEVVVAEAARGDRLQERVSSLRIRLLGAYHDGHVEFFYPTVFSYELHSSSSLHGVGDWLYDEFRLSPSGRLVHEIEWSVPAGGDGSRWVIEASDIEFQWRPR